MLARKARRERIEHLGSSSILGVQRGEEHALYTVPHHPPERSRGKRYYSFLELENRFSLLKQQLLRRPCPACSSSSSPLYPLPKTSHRARLNPPVHGRCIYIYIFQCSSSALGNSTTEEMTLALAKIFTKRLHRAMKTINISH